MADQESKRLVCGICGILLGGFGVHRFLMDDAKGGIIRLVISVVTCGAGGVIGLIEGIIYLTKSDEEFIKLYQNKETQKAWF